MLFDKLSFQICLDFLITLIRSYPADLPETMVQQAFPAIIQCVLKSDDSSTMQVCIQPCWSQWLNYLPDKLYFMRFFVKNPVNFRGCHDISIFFLILQSGGECLRAYVSKALAQVCEWRDENGIVFIRLPLINITHIMSKLNATF